MKNFNDYFKSKNDTIQFTLLYMSGGQRTALLGITARHYSNRGLADEWGRKMLTACEGNEEALKEADRIYGRMTHGATLESLLEDDKAEEVKAEDENLGAVIIIDNGPTVETPIPQRPVKDEPLDTVKTFYEEGGEVLAQKLEGLDTKALKAVIKANGLDTCRQTSHWRKPERLIAHIIAKSRFRATQGQVFRHYAL